MRGWPLLPCQGVAVAVAVAVAGLLHGIVVDDSLFAAAAVAASMALAQLQSGSGLLQQVVYCASPSHLARGSRIRTSWSSYPFLTFDASSCIFGQSIHANLGLDSLALSFVPDNI
jgi:hypothetical protein